MATAGEETAMAAGRGEKAARGRPEGVGGVRGSVGRLWRGKAGMGAWMGRKFGIIHSRRRDRPGLLQAPSSLALVNADGASGMLP